MPTRRRVLRDAGEENRAEGFLETPGNLLGLEREFLGGAMRMQGERKVHLVLPEHVVLELDSLARRHNVDRSGFIREATRIYWTQRSRSELLEQLKEGYQEMGSINLELAEL